MIHIAYIAVGSNIGDRLNNCLNGIEAFTNATDAEKVETSLFYQTEPLYVEDQDWFVNGVFSIKTKQSPFDLFDIAKKIEKQFGRNKTAQRYGPRVLDLDILLMDDMIVQTPQLTIPHPRLHERRFVLQPFCDIAPQCQHPVLKKNMKELLMSLDDGDKKVYTCQ
ncbi:2-amino-4-hydroxy-6-hydroxymethyldihydropteridine pyrophosphokinase [Candidatus Magnetomorum sp. HK-1]|nr:2-amino-4-hydroxy-6-hydroxymethyldihydropteridine pyrophosphokinase [Candidatus Magnetomorum sp. HK-1]